MSTREVSYDLRRAAARMNRVLPRNAVATLLGVSDSTVRRAVNDLEEHEDRSQATKDQKHSKNTILNDDDRKVSEMSA